MFHAGSSLDLHSIIQSGLIGGGKDTIEGRQTVFFTAVNPVIDSQEDELYDLMKPRKVPYNTRWKVHQDAENWINFKNCSGQRISILANAIILHDSVPADCLDQSGEHQKLKRMCIRNYHQRGTSAGRLVADDGKDGT